MKSKFDAISNKKSMKFYANLVENPNFWYLLTNKFKWGHFYDLPRFLNDNQWHKRNDRDLKQVTRGNKMANLRIIVAISSMNKPFFFQIKDEIIIDVLSSWNCCCGRTETDSADEN